MDLETKVNKILDLLIEACDTAADAANLKLREQFKAIRKDACPKCYEPLSVIEKVIQCTSCGWRPGDAALERKRCADCGCEILPYMVVVELELETRKVCCATCWKKRVKADQDRVRGVQFAPGPDLEGLLEEAMAMLYRMNPMVGLGPEGWKASAYLRDDLCRRIQQALKEKK